MARATNEQVGIILMEDVSLFGKSMEVSHFWEILMIFGATWFANSCPTNLHFQVYESATKGQCFEMARIIADFQVIIFLSFFIQFFQSQVHFMKDQKWRSSFLLNVCTTEIVDEVVKGVLIQALGLENEGKF